jgi:NleD-like pathogen effector protein (putative zinc metallopeptidase)
MIEKQFNIAIHPDFQTASDDATPRSVPFNKDLYLLGVRADLTRILKSEVGRHLAASLRYHSKEILLVPYPGQDGNAQEWWWGSSPKDNFSIVRFTPASGRSPCGAEIRKKRPATLPHEVLFHELVHSLRRISGKMKSWNLWGSGTLQPQGNVEEFIAIMVTNIFISDVTNHYKTGLRNDWTSHSPLDPSLAESYRFFALGTKAFNLIATFCDDNPGFTQMLSKARAHFNPVAAYYKNRRKAFEMAANGDAETVFAHMTPLDYVQNAAGAWTRLIPFPSPPARK